MHDYILVLDLHGAGDECESREEGEPFERQPCEPCFCLDGELSCAIVDCFFTDCDDPIPGEGACCPTCPEGESA